jgi:hypothetical protein
VADFPSWESQQVYRKFEATGQARKTPGGGRSLFQVEGDETRSTNRRKITPFFAAFTYYNVCPILIQNKYYDLYNR